VILLGAMGGFLVRNFYPASIFMGDSGSLFIGLALAALTTIPQREHFARVGLPAVIAPVMVLLIPIFDTGFVTLARLLSGKRPSQGGKDHFSHRLVVMGLSERRAVIVLWALAACGGLIGVSTLLAGGNGVGIFAAVFALAMLVFTVYLSHVRVYEDTDAEQLVYLGKITPVVADFLHKRRVAEVLLDFCLVSIAYYAAYALRFEGTQYGLYFPVFLRSFPLIVGIQIVSFFIAGVYRGVWRHFGLMDAVVLMRGVVLGILASVAVIVYLYRFENYSRGLFVVYGALLLVLVGASRASFRLIAEFVRRRQSGIRLVIYGAGEAGALTLQHLWTRGGDAYKFIGFVDDDKRLHGARVRGYSVLGGFDELTALIRLRRVDSIVMSSPAIQNGHEAALKTLCRDGRVSLSRLSIQVESLNIGEDVL
jgi:UDP-GlcNAc:undecaprenyl-phosphate GlcNAc-1-phosphate transferase